MCGVTLSAHVSAANAAASYLGEPGVVGIDDDFEQLLDTLAADRCDDPKLGVIRAFVRKLGRTGEPIAIYAAER